MSRTDSPSWQLDRLSLPLLGAISFLLALSGCDHSGGSCVLAAASSTPALQAGQPAPEFQVADLQGRAFDSRALRGRVVVLNFWFIACPPCRVEIPRLNRLVEQYRHQEVVFLALAADPPEPLRSFLAVHPFEYAVIPDATPIAQRFGIEGAPTHVVLDRNWRVVHVIRGAVEDVSQELAPWIDRALRTAP